MAENRNPTTLPGPVAPQPHSPALGPLLLQPITSERVWGVTTLPSWYSQPAPGTTVGELWLTAETCLAGNAKGDAGRTLGDLAAQRPELFGAADPSGFPLPGFPLPGFPLLVKLLLPCAKLSVQVHPDDAQARAVGEPRGKTECWYILSAEPGAAIALGFREDLSLSGIRDSIEQGTLEEKLRYVPVKAGDMVFVDAGTVHAIGPGVVILETQEYSDITYRLYDYGRPRELHIDAGLAVTRTHTRAGLVEPVPMNGFTRLVSCPYFTVDRFSLSPDFAAPLGEISSLQILVAFGEGCSIRSADASPIPLPPGHAVVLPAEGVAYTLSSTLDGSAPPDVIRILSAPSARSQR